MQFFINYLYKQQKIILPLSLFLVLIAISFRFDSDKTEWLWNDLPFIAVAMVSVAVLLVYVWINIERAKIQTQIDRIKNNTSGDNATDEKLDLLTDRQSEIFKLIIQGKSNKEIMDDLVIELSTLKTHINLIYKKLGIKSRKEVKLYMKSNKSD